VLEVLHHHAKFGGARISPAARAAKNVEFFCLSVCLSVGPIANLKGPYFQPSLSVCVSLTGTSTLQREPILTKLGHKDRSLI